MAEHEHEPGVWFPSFLFHGKQEYDTEPIKPFEGTLNFFRRAPMIDLLSSLHGGDCLREIKVGEHGVVKLIDCMPRVVESGKNWDHAILQAARVSYGADEKATTEKEDRGLMRYLWSHEHGTPFEMVDIKFYIALPIFVARQFIRHRMASVNEYSMRYKEPKDEFFMLTPDEVRKQSKNNKQGSEGKVEDFYAQRFSDLTQITAEESMVDYKTSVEHGIGKEMARINLPLTTFTYWYWEIDLRNFFGFLKLRMDSHAQKELRDYADAMYYICKPLAPYAFEAFNDFTRESIRLSKLEIAAMQRCSGTLEEGATKREQEAYTEKLKLLGYVEMFDSFGKPKKEDKKDGQ